MSRLQRTSLQILFIPFLATALVACATAPAPSPELQLTATQESQALTSSPSTTNPKAAPSPPSAQQPSYNPSDPTIPSDINCKPKLTLEPVKTVKIISAGNGDWSRGPQEAFHLNDQGLLVLSNGHPAEVGTKVKVADLDKVRIPYEASDLLNRPVAGPVAIVMANSDGNIDARPAVSPVGALLLNGDNTVNLNPRLHLYPVVLFADMPKVALPSGCPQCTCPVSYTYVQQDNLCRLKESNGSTDQPILLPKPPPPGCLSCTPDCPEGLAYNKKLHACAIPKPAIAALPVFDANGRPYSLLASVSSISDHYCHALSPLTRLILENAGVAANDTYSNQAGYTNASTSNIKTTIANTYQVGIGYSNKPILKQLRALFYPADGRDAASKQGTFREDVLYNAFTMNAYVSYGRALQIQNGTAVNAYNTRPYYGVSATYALDLERMWIYLTKGGILNDQVRAADQGYYFDARQATEPFFVDPMQPGRLRYPWDHGNDE